MIVRVSGEGQFRLPDEDADRLNELDNRAVAAVEQGDETGFHELWSQMLELVASDGNALDDDELVESDVILPPRDVTFARGAGRVHGRGPDPGLGARVTPWTKHGSRRIPLFAGLNRKERRALAPRADEVELEQGRAIVREGEWPYEFFAIEEGTAEVRRGEQLLAELGPGDFFGEMGLVGDARRNATRGRHLAGQGGRDDRAGVPPDGARAARGGEQDPRGDRGARRGSSTRSSRSSARLRPGGFT